MAGFMGNSARAGSLRFPILAVIALTAIAAGRIVSSYGSISQAFDEPAHIACGMEWLDKGTFELEPLHPPLARIAAAIGPYLAGARLPKVAEIVEDGSKSYDIYPAGNEILFTDGRYARNLNLARLGEMPFLLLGIFLVFAWTQRHYGNWAAVLAVLLYTTLPAVLAFAGIAYVDFALSVMLPCAVFALVLWLENPSARNSVLLGIAGGLMVLANLSSLLFAPVCGLPILACFFWKRERGTGQALSRYLGTAGLAIVLAAVTLWAGYRFSIVPLNQAFEKPADDVALLPSSIRPLAGAVVRMNPPLPAPDFFRGIVSSWAQNKKSLPSYALGQVRRGGFWYFYWLDLGLKTPLPFLILAIVGAGVSLRPASSWQELAAPVAAIAILLVSMVVKVDFGIRHLLFVYPFLTMMACTGAVYLWRLRPPRPLLAPMVVLVLVALQIGSSFVTHPDYLSYFNLLAGKSPQNLLLFGCDLDCGQDVGKLVQAVHDRGITHLTMQVWTSADLKRMNLPPFETLPAGQRATGWIAVSLLYLRSGEGLWRGTNLDAYAWLNAYQPVAQIGKTIRLYRIPEP